MTDCLPISLNMLKKHEKATIIRLFYRPFYTFAARKHIHPSTMKKILRVVSPNDYARYVDAPVLHPLVSVICYDEVSPFRHSLNNYGVYGLFIPIILPASSNA